MQAMSRRKPPMSELRIRKRRHPELYEAFERFAIMTVDGHVPDNEAIDQVAKEFGFSAAVYVRDVACECQDVVQRD